MSFFILFVLMLSIMKNNMLYLVYEYDSQLFENLFCRNIDTPELECHGQCMLDDMQKDRENDSHAAILLKQLQTEVLYFQDFHEINVSNNLSTEYSANHFSPYENSYFYLYSKEELKPPISFIS